MPIYQFKPSYDINHLGNRFDQALPALAGLLLLGALLLLPAALARTVATPWTNDVGMQNLILGSSSMGDVQYALGKAPDEILRSEQMFPVVENAYYYDEKGSGSATVFVFENGMLVGMYYRSPNNQFMDLSYVLTNNGDQMLHRPMLSGYQGYFPFFPMYSMY